MIHVYYDICVIDHVGIQMICIRIMRYMCIDDYVCIQMCIYRLHRYRRYGQTMIIHTRHIQIIYLYVHVIRAYQTPTYAIYLYMGYLYGVHTVHNHRCIVDLMLERRQYIYIYIYIYVCVGFVKVRILYIMLRSRITHSTVDVDPYHETY